MDLQKTALQRAVTGADGPSIRSAPVSIPARATCAQGLSLGEPVSPTASLQGDKYILVRAPKPQFRTSQLAEADVKADIVKSVSSATADQKSEPYTTRVLKDAGMSVSRMLRPKAQRMRIRMPFSIAFSSTVGGLVNGALSVQPDSNSTEWAGAANLFDIWRMNGFTFEFFIPAISPAGGTSGLTVDNGCVVVYDPVDNTALSNVRNGTEYSHHTLVFPSPILGTATTSATMKYGFQQSTGKPYRLKVTMPPAKRALALAINSTGQLAASPGQWKSILAAGSNNSEGFIKVYCQTDYTTVATALTGIVHCDVDFDSRR